MLIWFLYVYACVYLVTPLKEGGRCDRWNAFCGFSVQKWLHSSPITFTSHSINNRHSIKTNFNIQHECTHLHLSAEEEHSPSDVYSMAGWGLARIYWIKFIQIYMRPGGGRWMGTPGFESTTFSQGHRLCWILRDVWRLYPSSEVGQIRWVSW